MPQIEFDGQGTPIPVLALPPFGSDDSVPPTSLIFTDNADFSVVDYRNLGFTHFEAWCVGAAGGRGGDATSEYVFVKQTALRSVPSSVWTTWLDYIRTSDYFTAGEWDHVYVGGDAGLGKTAVQLEEMRNPNHLLPQNTYKLVLLSPSAKGLGGGGGGGGFQHVSGLLTDLPDSVPIVVGKAGTDAPVGQTKQNGLWTTQMSDDSANYFIFNTAGEVDPLKHLHELINYFTVYNNSYPNPHSAFNVPQAGADGGATTFADTVCRASGGKGGSPGMIWDGTKFVVNGAGGAGGLGGRTVAGGGGAGSVTDNTNGADGVWNPETGIGGGGGGGKGGHVGTTTVLGSSGGQGSYSFGDTTVYGQRGVRQNWVYQRPVAALPADGTYSLIDTNSGTPYVPGGGGGARPASNLKFGSKAVGFSPDGVVVVRLVRIT